MMGRQIVDDLNASTTAALVALIPDLINKLSPMATPSAGTNIVGGFLHANGSDTPSSDTMSSAAATSAAIPSQSSDPAYATAVNVISYLSLMQAFVNGKDGGIDWEAARGSVKLVSAVLADTKDRFSSIATSAEPSSTMASVLDTALTVR